MPEKALPTFNSEAIETCIMNINELSEYFLFANDDMFINKPIKPDYFFDKNNNPILMLGKSKDSVDTINDCLYLENIRYSQNLLYNTQDKKIKFCSRHNIEAYRKSYIKACKDEFLNEFNRTAHYKFRTKNSIQRTIYALWQLKNIKSKIHENSKDQIFIGLNNTHKIDKKLKKYNPKLICYNDTETTTNENREELINFLNKKYPEPAEWEIKSKFEIEPIFNSSHARTIVFAPDNKFCKYFAVTLQSLIENSKNYEKYDIIIFDSDIEERNKTILLKMLPSNFSLRFFNTNNYIKETLGSDLLKNFKYWSVSMYYRIFIPLLMPKYERVLYLDSDTIVNNSIEDFINLDFDNNEIMAVIDLVNPLINIDNSFKTHIKTLKFNKPENYFNSGVIMFNIQKIDTKNYIKNFKNILQNTKLLYPDQDILNIMFQDKTKLIHPKYNYQYGIKIIYPKYESMIFGKYKNEFLEAKTSPSIIHYTTQRKPWKYPKEELADIFWHYARKCPFYEEIIFENFINENTLKNLENKFLIYYTYYKSKIFSRFTYGERKKHYKNKAYSYKCKIRDIRRFSK